MRRLVRAGVLGLVVALSMGAECQMDEATVRGPLELTSELGRQLYGLPADQTVVDARKALDADPKNVDLELKLSKALAARRQYKEAVDVVTAALTSAPTNADLYLERGHRRLGLRDFQGARKDLEMAAKLAPDMLDAHYHLGLSHYFVGDFKGAATEFDRARTLAKTDDSLIDCSNWLYVSLRRAGDQTKAAAVLERITPKVKNTEPHLYFYLRLLRFYQGQVAVEDVLPPAPKGPTDVEGELSFNTVSYGVGNWRIYHGEPASAIALFKNVVKGEAWNSWGFIGAEMELKKLGAK